MKPAPLQMTCKEFVELVTAHLDGSLVPGDRIRFEQHRESCPGCQAYLQQFHLTIKALSATPRETIEPQNLDELLRAFRESKPAPDPDP